jgi:mannose-1-phosphate guanylyltransferase
MLHAVIMAGGTGTRFWPESRASQPKQLLRMTDERTMLRATVDRLGDLVPLERIVISTTASLAGKIADELPELPREAILAEPCKRNTAPCIGLAAAKIVRHDPKGVMAVMPADHVISPDESFRRAIRFAEALVEHQAERLVTFGIRPSYPAESFGYIEQGETLESKVAAGFDDAPPVCRVGQFREKPDADTAQRYLDKGTFFWNSGIFVWRAQTILDGLAEHEPEIRQGLDRIAGAADSPQFDEVLRREFEAMKGISIDYAVMERAAEVLMIEAPFEWDDVGSWQSLARLRGTDEQGNTVAAKHLGIETTGSIVRSADDHLVVTVGLTDCIVVHTPDATLVANKHDEEAIRKVVEELKRRGWEGYL